MALIAPVLIAVTVLIAASPGPRWLVAPRSTSHADVPPRHVATSRVWFARRHGRWLQWGAGILVTALAAGFGAAAVVLVVGLLTRPTRALVTQRRAGAARQLALPDAIDTFVLLVHAGLTPRRAVEHLADVAPAVTRPAFAEVVHRMRRGEPFADALAGLLGFFGTGAVALVDLVAASSRYGLPMAEVLAQLSNETRATRRRLDEAAARALPVRLSFPLVVCTLPSFVLLAIVPAVLAALSSLGNNTW